MPTPAKPPTPELGKVSPTCREKPSPERRGERPDSPDLADAMGEAYGVYIHVPFCSHKCGYCDFASWAGIDDLQERYVSAVVAEAERGLGRRPADTVFIGGGTPSRLMPGLLTRLLGTIPVTERAEVTCEANPESASHAFFAEAVSAGVNRVSLGMQSSAPHVLRFLEREHPAGSVGPAVAAARVSGIESVNLDLIFGTPGETLADWRASLDAALVLEPDHLSVYALTVEPATPLGRRVKAGEAPGPDDDACADRYGMTQAILADAGYVQYEISNWARPGHACRHNLLYWAGGSYDGLGCSAHSHDRTRHRRWWNIAAPARYCEAVEEGRDPEAGSEVLTAAEVEAEKVMLGLRRVAGVPEHMLAPAYPASVEAAIERRGGRVRIRPERLFTAHSVITRV